MPYFDINPTSGEMSGEVRINPTSSNYNNYDRNTNVTVGSGGVAKFFAICQYGLPYMVGYGLEETAEYTTTFPASGGTLLYMLFSHYPWYFQSKPWWITITDELGNTINEGSVQPAMGENPEECHCQFIHFTAVANTGATRNSGNFRLLHRLRGSEAAEVVYIQFDQEAAESTPSITTPSDTNVPCTGGTVYVDILVPQGTPWHFANINNNYGLRFYDSAGTEFNYWQDVHSGTGVTERYSIVWPSYSGNEPRTCKPVLSMRVGAGAAYYDISPSFTFTQNPCGQEPIAPNPQVTSEDTSAIPSTGGTKTITVNTPNEWWWSPNLNDSYIQYIEASWPSWVSITDEYGANKRNIREETVESPGVWTYTFGFSANTSNNVRIVRPDIRFHYFSGGTMTSSATGNVVFKQYPVEGTGPYIYPKYGETGEYGYVPFYTTTKQFVVESEYPYWFTWSILHYTYDPFDPVYNIVRGNGDYTPITADSANPITTIGTAGYMVTFRSLPSYASGSSSLYDNRIIYLNYIKDGVVHTEELSMTFLSDNKEVDNSVLTWDANGGQKTLKAYVSYTGDEVFFRPTGGGDGSWLTISPTIPTGQYNSFTVTCSPNNTGEERSGMIEIPSHNTLYVYVKQSA